MLMDLKMPRKSGLELLEWVRQQPGLKRLPIIVLTSSNQSPDINRAYELGANSYLSKPTGLEEGQALAEMIGQYWLNRNRLASSSRAKCVA